MGFKRRTKEQSSVSKTLLDAVGATDADRTGLGFTLPKKTPQAPTAAAQKLGGLQKQESNRAKLRKLGGEDEEDTVKRKRLFGE